VHPIRLSDAEMSAVLDAAKPIHVNDRDEFLRAIAHALNGQGGQLGPGTIFRIAREVQARFLVPPNTSDRFGGKHSRGRPRKQARVDIMR
jgi:hypothetical protein